MAALDVEEPMRHEDDVKRKVLCHLQDEAWIDKQVQGVLEGINKVFFHQMHKGSRTSNGVQTDWAAFVQEKLTDAGVEPKTVNMIIPFLATAAADIRDDEEAARQPSRKRALGHDSAAAGELHDDSTKAMMEQTFARVVPETLPSTQAEFIEVFKKHFTRLPIHKHTKETLEARTWFQPEVAKNIFDAKDDGTPFSWACAAIVGGRQPSFKCGEVEDSMHSPVDAVLSWFDVVSGEEGRYCRNKKVKRTPGRPKTGARPDVALSIDENRLRDIFRGEEKVVASYQRGDPEKDPEMQLLQSYPPALLWEGTYGKKNPYAFGFTAMGSADQLHMTVGLIVPKSVSERQAQEESLAFIPLGEFDLNKKMQRLEAFVFTLNLYRYMVKWERNIPNFAIPDIGGLVPVTKDLYFDYEEHGVFTPGSVPCTLHFSYDRDRHAVVKVFKISTAKITDGQRGRLTHHFTRISEKLATVDSEITTHITVSSMDTPTPTSAAASSSADQASDHFFMRVSVSPPCYQTPNCIPEDAESILDAVQHTLEALVQVHATGLLHRDVRWPNIGKCGDRWLLFDWDEAAPMGVHEKQPFERFGELNSFPDAIRVQGYRDHHVDIYAALTLLLDETAMDLVCAQHRPEVRNAITDFCYRVRALSNAELYKDGRTKDNATFTTKDVCDAYGEFRRSLVENEGKDVNTVNKVMVDSLVGRLNSKILSNT